MPALIFLLVLALAALGVWWHVFQQDRVINAAQAAACTSATAAPPSLAPGKVSLRIYNAGAKAGAAGAVAAELKARGFVIGEVANDPRPEFHVTGVGEVRFGPAGVGTARYVALLLPGATERPDTRATGLVDLVLGPNFTRLATPAEVDAALAPAAGAAVPGC